ncbi:DC-STAMP domain-containing protein 2 [Amphiprion ocellaris]|uniref:DC-STAMP domain-containing protein 2 n=1 Tax=Amphiprion ocellaris TaxID=80972 RepID=UPI00241179D5|nr:DC-STAMP domain-containing protein 2 [Amphiprion ocellaris]
MKSEAKKRHLERSDIIVQVERGGVTEAVTGVLNRSAVRSRSRKFRGHLIEAGRSLLAFVLGLLLASVYGLLGLLLQKQSLWFCVQTTLVVGGLAAFGMGLSAGVRADVSVMLPTLCSARGRNLVLLLYVSVLLSGPLANTLENTERAASSLLCGAELAANQTQELMQRAATPLFSALNEIKEISRNAYAVAGRVQNLIFALTDGVRHVARTLRNVLHFVVDIGDVCNAQLSSPYRKCRSLFAEARSDCSDLLGDFDFLCGIVDAFLPLCSVARVGELFCIIPSYIAEHLKERLADPIIAAFQKLKREFEFNLTASVNLDVDANSSRSLQQVSQDILKELSADLQVFEKLSEPLTYLSLVLLAWSFLRAVRYRRRYLSDISFDNKYITAQFEEFNQHVTLRGGASVLPITCREAKIYITPFSLQLTARERRTVLVGVSSVLRHLLIGCLLVGLDFLVFWILDQVNHQVKGDIVARAPVSVEVQVNGSGYASDIFRDLLASFNVLQGGNITVVSRKCLLQPSEPDTTASFILGFLLGLALLISLTGGFMQRCRRIICASFHPERELERIQFLHQHILDQRRSVGEALRMSVSRVLRRSRIRADQGGGRNLIQSLLIRLPGGARLSHLLSPPLTCLSCGEQVKPDDDNTITCDVPQCSGLYCQPCFLSLGNTCVVCTRPVTFQEDEEERDSDDDEQSCSAALNSTHSRRTVSTATRQTNRAVSRTDGVSELSEADMRYQDRPGSDESDESDSDDSFLSVTSQGTSFLQDQALATVQIHTPQNLQEPPGASRSFQEPPGP